MGNQQNTSSWITVCFASWKSVLHVTISVLLWVVLVGLAALNVTTHQKTRAVLQTFSHTILKHPYNPIVHISAAKTMQESGYTDLALRELAVAEDLLRTGNVPPDVLGAQQEINTLETVIQKEPDVLREAYSYWASVTKTYPEYRDGYILAGVYAYLTDHPQEGSSYLLEAYQRDPYYKPLMKILEYFGVHVPEGK